MPVLEFLRDIGKHFSVNRMLDRESVKARLEAGGISYTEFSYQLLQAMDFLELYRRYGCTLAARRQRPVGQPGRGRGPDQEGRGSVRARPGHAADHQAGRHQVRQDRGRRDLAQRRPDVAVRVLPVLAERVRRRGAEPAARIQLQIARGDRGAGSGKAPSGPRPGSASARWPRRSPRSCTAPTRPVARSRPARPCSARGPRGTRRAHAGRRGELTRCGRPVPVEGPQPWWRRPALRPVGPTARRQPDGAAGTVPSMSAARRAIAEGGAYLNNQKVTDVSAVPGPGDLLHGRFLILRGASAPSAPSRSSPGNLQACHRTVASCIQRSAVSVIGGTHGCVDRRYGALMRQCKAARAARPASVSKTVQMAHVSHPRSTAGASPS